MTDSPQPTGDQAPAVPLFGRVEALRMIGDDEELLGEVAALAQTEIARQLAALKVALAAGDAPGASREAHTIKGTVATLGAQEVRDMAMVAEHAARDGDLDAARATMDHLESLCTRLIAELADYLAGSRTA
jgi:HPt (histidine-containing phosphotransfer) domain-containing protein